MVKSQNKVKILILLGVLLVSFSVFKLDVKAHEQFSVRPVVPSNQDIGVTDYISITETGTYVEQEIEFEVTNRTAEAITLTVRPLNALTSPNGVIQYTDKVKDGNTLLLDYDYSMARYIEIQESLELSPMETKRIKGKLQIDGVPNVILGGVGFTLFEEGEVERKQEGQFRINNQMNTVIGVLVKFGGEDDKVVFDIGEPFVQQMPSYYGIRLPVAFDTSLLLKGVDIEYEVLDEKRREIFKADRDLIFNFAPKTKPNILFPWLAEDIEVGKTYILKGALKFDNERVEFERTFKLTGDDLITSGTGVIKPPSIKNTFNWLWLLGVLLLLLLLIGRRKQYVLPSAENMEILAIIEQESELFNKVVLYKEFKKTNPSYEGYLHIYKREGKKDNYRYRYLKTLDLTNEKGEDNEDSD